MLLCDLSCSHSLLGLSNAYVEFCRDYILVKNSVLFSFQVVHVTPDCQERSNQASNTTGRTANSPNGDESAKVILTTHDEGIELSKRPLVSIQTPIARILLLKNTVVSWLTDCTCFVIMASYKLYVYSHLKSFI